MEGVAQLAEHRVVAPVAVGSSPTALPTTRLNRCSVAEAESLKTFR